MLTELVMEATFVGDPQDGQNPIFRQMLRQFAGRKVKVTVEEVPDGERVSLQREMFLKSEKTNKKYPPQKISPDIDINALIDQMYGENNH